MIPRTIILLCSGGLDSVTGLYDLKKQGHFVSCVGIDYGQRHVQELEMARYHCHRLGVVFTRITIEPLRGSTLTDGSGGIVVPNRNAVFLSIAVNIAIAAGADTVAYFCNKDDEAAFPDCRMAFVQTFNNMLVTAEIQVEVCAPYIQKSKTCIACLARTLDVEVDQTWSCYSGGKAPCGECDACKKRELALVASCLKGVTFL